MGPYLGDYLEDATVDFIWDSNDANGASITRATNGTIAVYKGNNVTQSTVGLTDTEDFDTITGIHHVRIDLSADAFYAVGNDYNVVLSGATIDGQTVNAVLASFSIENRSFTGVAGRLGSTAADGDPTSTDTVMAYIKQLINILVGTAGVVTFPAEAAPGNAVSLAEVIRAIYTDSNELQGLIASSRIAADAQAISGSVTAADTLETSVLSIVTGAAVTGTLSTTQMSTNLTEVTDDHYKDGALIWTSGVLNQERRLITGYNGTTKVLTYEAATDAPSDGDTFIIV